MAEPRFNDPIEPMDLANMRQNGVRSLDVQRNDHLPGDLTPPSFGPKMVCTKCGTIGAGSIRLPVAVMSEPRGEPMKKSPAEHETVLRKRWPAPGPRQGRASAPDGILARRCGR
jgi:hypothetical protein